MGWTSVLGKRKALQSIRESAILLRYPDHSVFSIKEDEGFMTATKADIAQKIADDCGFMRGEATEIVEKLLGIVKDKLIEGEDVMISGFGKWSVKDKHARRGRNPQTGEELILDARRVVTWNYSPVLKKAVNQR
jgi:integration host factor subunit alpha